MKCSFSLTILLLCCLSSALSQDCGGEEITVTIDIITLAETPVGTVSGNINGSLSLECAVALDVPGTVSDTEPLITSYVWTRNGDTLNEFTGKMLQIIHLRSSDGGVYRCSAVTDLPCTTMQSDETVVNTAPTVSLSPSSNISAVVGDNVEITCDVEGWPTPSLSWRKATTSNTVIEISQNPVLVIDSATTADSEQYSCVADNGFTDQDAIMTQTITITIATVTDPVTLAPTDVTLGAVDSANNLGGPVIRPTENGFYIAIAVTTFVCLFLTGTTIFSVTIWCYKKRKSEREAEYQEEEESNTDLQTIETSLMY